MTPAERKKISKDIAGIVARGYDEHIKLHGPDGSHAIRNSTGGSYLINSGLNGYISYVVRNDEIFEVTVNSTGVSA